MGIDNVAIQTFNSSGSQSVCRANKYKEDTLIESEFLTKCTTRYISGTGQTVVQGSITGFPIGLPSNASNHDTFDMPDDIDAISNIILTGRMTFDIPENTDDNETNFSNSTAIYFSSTMFLSIIDKIEIKLGGLIIDTISSDTIFARNTTEISGDVCSFSGSSNTGNECPNIYTNINERRRIDITQDAVGNQRGSGKIKDNIVEWSISVPFTGRGSKMSDAFLQAGSSTNTLSMKVYYKQFNPLNTNLIPTPGVSSRTTSSDPTNTYPDGRAYWPMFGYQHLTDDNNMMMAKNWKFSTSATVTTHMMTETEKNFIRNNVINRVLKTSETLEYQTPEKLVNVDPAGGPNNNVYLDKPTGEFREISFDISAFDCNCSHILLSLREPSGNSGGGFSPSLNGWPHTKGKFYNSAKTSSAAIAAAGTSGAPARGAWPKQPFYEKWWSREDNIESAGPLIPSNNMGEFNTHNFCPVKHKTFKVKSNKTTATSIDNNGIQSDVGFDADGTIRSTFVDTALEALTATDAPEFYPNTGVHGYPDNWLHSVELVIGGERTGFIPSTALKSSNLEEFGLKYIDNQGGLYVIKLADSAFSTSGIPFARCNNIKLNIRINNSIYSGGREGSSTLQGQGIEAVSTFITPAAAWGRTQPKLVATACGTTIQTTVGGSISLAA